MDVIGDPGGVIAADFRNGDDFGLPALASFPFSKWGDGAANWSLTIIK